jgi:predicted amidohydrolase YtcJ
VIDGGGMFLMPGMAESHCHPSFVGISTNAELGRIPPENPRCRRRPM